MYEEIPVFTSRQKEIIDAAIHLIARKGIQEVTMKNLSREVGISEPALYRHFNGKHDIMKGILDSFSYHNKLMSGRPFDPDKTALENLEHTVLQVFRKFTEYPELSSVIFSEEIFQNEEDLTAQVTDLMAVNREVFKGMITAGIKDGSLRNDINKEDMSLIIIGVMRLLVIRWRLSRYSFDLVRRGERLFRRTIQVLLEK